MADTETKPTYLFEVPITIKAMDCDPDDGPSGLAIFAGKEDITKQVMCAPSDPKEGEFWHGEMSWPALYQMWNAASAAHHHATCNGCEDCDPDHPDFRH